jgi:Skp family chaperone for outer membrane proteins
MKLRNLALAAAFTVGLANMAGAALAQTKVFVVDEDRVRRDSKVGKEISAAIGDFATKAGDQLGLKTLKTELESESARLKPQTESLTPEALNANPTLKAQVDGLNKKANEFLQKQNVLNKNIEQRDNGMGMAFLTVLAPAVDSVAKDVGADVVISYAQTWYVKDATDITAKVIARLDATVPTLAALQAALPPPPAGAAKPAAGAKPSGGGQ